MNKPQIVIKYLNLGFNFPLNNGDLVKIHENHLCVQLKETEEIVPFNSLDHFLALCNGMSDELISKFQMEMKVRKHDKDSKK